jgi:hypothetical protein
MKIKRKKNYVDSNVLEENWGHWLETGDPVAWEKMGDDIYKICSGVATHFNPKSEDEYVEHVHDAFTQIIEKIKDRKLVFIKGKAPVFNFITTTAFRILFSKMNKRKKNSEHIKKYTIQELVRHNPEMLKTFEVEQIVKY